MERKLQQTADGSHTLYIPELDEHYHSVNGALREAEHIFIEAGLRSLPRRELRVLEIGFGTGLNAFLTWKEAEQALIPRIDYYTVELYPLPLDLARRLNYGQLAWPGREERFLALHEAEWGVDVPLSERFVLHKIQGDSNTVSVYDFYLNSGTDSRTNAAGEQVLSDATVNFIFGADSSNSTFTATANVNNNYGAMGTHNMTIDGVNNTFKSNTLNFSNSTLSEGKTGNFKMLGEGNTLF